MPKKDIVKNIPIHRDSRSFEKQKRDTLNTLERKMNNHGQTVLHGTGNPRMQEMVPWSEDWFKQLNDWVNNSWNQWGDEMRRMRNSMFSLLPLDNFGIQNWFNADMSPDLENLMDRMESHIQDIRDHMGLSEWPISGTLPEYLNNAYEVKDDGQVYFNVRFDAKGFAPEDIQVNSSGNRLTVSAKKVSEMDGSKSSRSFCRIIELPHSIDQNQLKCNLSDDGVLSLSAMVKDPDYQSLTFNKNRQLGIKPVDKEPTSPDALQIRDARGPVVVDDGGNGQKLYLQINIDPVYKAKDLCINVDSNHIVVSGSHGKRSKLWGTCDKSRSEFRNSYAIPGNVDLLSMKAQLIGNKLVIEAPLIKEHKVECEKPMEH